MNIEITSTDGNKNIDSTKASISMPNMDLNLNLTEPSSISAAASLPLTPSSSAQNKNNPYDFEPLGGEASYSDLEFDTFLFSEPFTPMNHVEEHTKETPIRSFSLSNEIDHTEEGEVLTPISHDFQETTSLYSTKSTFENPLSKKKHYDQPPQAKKNTAKKRKRNTPKCTNNDDMWDDSVVIESWNRGIEKFRKQQRGEPVSDSEEEFEENIENEKPEEQKENCNLDLFEQSLESSFVPQIIKKDDEEIISPQFVLGTPQPLTSLFSDSELLEKIYTS
ncbi:hypothetical protein HMI54_007766, partial [Coelomomyces lativittatus]